MGHAVSGSQGYDVLTEEIMHEAIPTLDQLEECQGVGWYARQDSNLRPLVPETSALSS